MTGGTGFVGSHTVRALIAAGHRVRLLVRDPRRVPKDIAEGEDPSTAVGDVTDAASVQEAMEGCDAVWHGASVYSLDVRRAAAMWRTNVEGARMVLGAARRAALDPIVYVSTVFALCPPARGEVLSGRSEPKHPPGAYYGSKTEAERVARGFQAEGAAVVTSYPGGAFGPGDPYFGENAQAVRDILTGRVPLGPPGGLTIVDVRDVALAHAAMFVPGRGPRRYVLSGHNIRFAEIVRILSELTGRRIFHRTLPAWSMRPMISLGNAVQRCLPFRMPFSREGFDAIAWDPHGDDSEARRDLGFDPRDPRETLADMVRWMAGEGHISRRQAGKLG
ncbi:MAG: NAD-dependent epimerase/dehydratase family protein [Chloroflexi bacterium]|nr:NAD-dependent epimerase/dehydratase family protein [Chloroflexota bacterium]